MPREKKDGRYINYYLARNIYEQVARYAKENGHTMTWPLSAYSRRDSR